jgi:putative transposase
MSYVPEKHHRRSIRLQGYDYSQPGMYFVTICTQGKELLFGEVAKGEMAVNKYGRMIWEEWYRSAEIRREVRLDEFMVMPNHLHGIVVITSAEAHGVGAIGRHEIIAIVVGAHGRAPLQHRQLHRQPRSLGSFVAGFKSATTKRINDLRGTPGVPLWQRNYYEHVIRNEEELHRIREYIQTNPLRWELDRENPARRGEDEFDRWLASFSAKRVRTKE